MFSVPILDDLVREFVEKNSPLVGVRALFLYPLNALINSQQERLAAWTAGLRGGIRFCLYNGATPDSVPQATAAGDARSRCSAVERSRTSPPPILVTNATMLEYMLVRHEDVPILQKSRGMLRWIVLDEAHTYLGSNAAEISLLLRRVMHAFVADPQHVRFVATSATIGSKDDKAALERYLADLAGVPVDRVLAIDGRRVTPPLTPEQEQAALPIPSREQLEALLTYDERRDRLARVPAIRQLRHELTKQARQLEEIRTILGSPIPPRTCCGCSMPVPKRRPIVRKSHSHSCRCGETCSCGRKQAPGLAGIPPAQDEKIRRSIPPSWPFGEVFLERRQDLHALRFTGVRTCVVQHVR